MILILSVLIAFLFSLVFLHTPFITGGILILLGSSLPFILRFGFIRANIFFITLCVLLFSSDSYMLMQSRTLDIYSIALVNSIGIFEIWILGVFFVFLISSLMKRKTFIIGPLWPLIVFVFLGVVIGLYGAIIVHKGIGLNQIKFYIEGLLLYFILINHDLENLPRIKILWGIVFVVTLNSSYYLLKYLIGKGLAFGVVGKITIGCEDTLEIITLVCLMLIAAFVKAKRTINQKEYIFGSIALIINTAVIFFSLRRANMGAYLIGFFLIWFLANQSKKIYILLALGGSLFIGCLFLSTTGHSNAINKIFLRIDSINVLKYHDDTAEKLTSSMGHLTEIRNGWLNVKENIVFGKGLTAEIDKRNGLVKNLTMVHNELLFYWIRMGFAGVLIFFCMYLIPLYYCYMRLKMNDSQWQWLFLGLMAFVLGRFFVQITIAPPISLVPTKCYLYFITLGIAMNPYFFKKNIETN